MGIEHRDYYRNASPGVHRPSGFGDMPIVCKRLLIAIGVVFVAQMFFTRPSNVEDLRSDMITEQELESMRQQSPEDYEDYVEGMLQWSPRVSTLEDFGNLAPAKVLRGQVWRLVTYAFLHHRYAIWGLIINLLFLYWLGTRLEQMYGSREFCLFYFASAIVAGLAYVVIAAYTGSTAATVGASGAVWGLVALYVIHHPYERIHIYFLFPIEIRWLALIYLIYDLHPVLLALNGDRNMLGAVSQAAHLGGAAFGAAYFYQSWRLAPIWDRVTRRAPTGKWQTRTVRREPRAVVPFDRGELNETRNTSIESRMDPAAKKLEAQLDEVLEKIQSEGRDALTDAEVQILEEASQRYRER